jgi:hypothetical protein
VGKYIFNVLTFHIQYVSPGQEMHEIYTSVNNDTLPTEAVGYDNNVYFICTKAHTCNYYLKSLEFGGTVSVI